jgi:hypothetical protein
MRNAHREPQQPAASLWFITAAKIGSHELWIILCVSDPKHLPGQSPRRGARFMSSANLPVFIFIFNKLLFRYALARLGIDSCAK